jgi:hypothetical protein
VDIQLNQTTHDLEILNGDIVLVDGVEEVAQRIKIELMNIRGEWFRDVNHGADWYKLLSKSGNKGLIDAQVKTIILSDKDILSIINYNSVANKTNLNIYFTANTKFGEVINVEATL